MRNWENDPPQTDMESRMMLADCIAANSGQLRELTEILKELVANVGQISNKSD